MTMGSLCEHLTRILYMRTTADWY